MVDPELRWKTLYAEPRMMTALDEADEAIARGDALAGGQNEKRKWSEGLANACAMMVANEMRESMKIPRGLDVLPHDGGKVEPPVFVAGGQKKRVDVVVSSAVSGLQLGVSLKGLNFKDKSSGNYDKNLTGRTYELIDEVRMIHGYQPAAFMSALYFLPLAAASDKRGPGSTSSFAHAVVHLRKRTTRSDKTLASQYARTDASYVALYETGVPEYEGHEPESNRGAVRFFDVLNDPPRWGRPKLETTLGLKEYVLDLYRKWQDRIEDHIDWPDPEED